ncbi:hypothetical protein BS50DRAFT_616891 [Corynespora cassiicola Philippines]|uniref:Peptidase C14 caspase domain-containing protein n=1 Tax=Corynespora cassiicola Philippines TaxID=1448308 RepID=A0A2T2P782_CORCC|nr:hypothetical protein BS50DRAFT_616891 [Corynespora cassiicola Philippines]
MLPPIANTPFEQGPVSSDSNPEAEGYTTEVQCNPGPPLVASQSQDSRLIESRGHHVNLPENPDENRVPVQQTVDEAGNDYQVEVSESRSEPPLEQGMARDADSHTELPPSPHTKQPFTDLHSKDVNVGDTAVASPDPTRHELTEIPKAPSGDQIDQELERTILEGDNNRMSLEEQEHPKALQAIATSSEESSPQTKEISSVSKVPESQSSRWAILIGIDFYPEHDQRNEGRVVDVRLFKEALEPHGPMQVREFTASNDVEDENQSAPIEDSSQWPTRENIMLALKDVAGQAKEGDHVIFFYTGLGFVRNRSIEASPNNDGIDVAPMLIKLQDGELKEDFMPGGELNQVFDSMTNNGSVLTVVLECNPPNYNIQNPLPSKDIDRSPPEEDLITKGRIKEPDEAKDTDDYLLKPYCYTLLADYGSYEFAEASYCDHQFKHGLFSCAFITALKSNKWPESVGNLQLVYVEICQLLRIFKPYGQSHIVLLGDLSHTFFGARNPENTPIPRFNVIKRDRLRSTWMNAEIWINAGKMHGVSVEDRYRVCSTTFLETGAPKPNHEFQIIKISETYELSSRAILDFPYYHIILGWHAYLIYHGRTRAQVKISPDLDSKLSDEICQSHWLNVIDNPDGHSEADVLEVTQDANQMTTIKFRNRTVFEIPSPSETRDKFAPQEKFTSALEHLAKFLWFGTLANESNDALTDEDFTVRVLQDGENKGLNHVSIYDGQKISIDVQNNTEFSLYYIIYSMEFPSGRISLKYEMRSWYKTPKDSSSSPGKQPVFVMHIPEDMKKKGYTQREETFKIFVATQPYYSPSVLLPAIWDEDGSNENISDFLFFLDEANSSIGFRSAGEQVLRASWATRSFNFEIKVPESSSVSPV